jgi:hypothetical protein
LYPVLAITIVIALLASSLIAVAYFYRVEQYKNHLVKKLELNAGSAVNLLLADDEIPYGEERVLDLFEEGTDSVIVGKDHWGLFEIGKAGAFSKSDTVIKCLEFGYRLKNDFALYLADQGRPLLLGGKTFIKGDCFLPEAGVKRAFVDGQFFTGKELVNGKIQKSNASLPEINSELKDRLFKIFKENGFSEYQEQTLTDSLINSFFNKTVLIVHDNSQLLLRKYLEGNIILYSRKSLVIDSSCRLNNILIFAPAVTISDGFTGSVQVFAKDSLIIGENCFLKYPSALGLFKSAVLNKQPFIQVGKNSTVKGIIFTSQEIFDQEGTKVSMKEGSLLEGQLYADGFAELQGTVYGSIACNKFTLKTASSVYENHLLNATIDNSKLSASFVGSALIFSENEKSIIKWLQ